MTGAIYDRGYRPYEGDRGGRRAARTGLVRATVRRALGLRRSWRQKVVPFALLGVAVIPAVVNVGVKYLTRDTVASDVEFFTYREYVGVSNALLVFVALTAPDIVCPDRRQRVLPLIFARPLTGVDYVLAKVGAMFAILFAFSFLPQVVLFVGQMLVSDDGALDYLRDNAEILWQVPISVGALALYYAVFGVALASLTSRRIIAGATIVGLLLVSSIVSAAVTGPQERVAVSVEGRADAPTGTTPDGGIIIEGPVEGGPPGSGFDPGPRVQYRVIESDPTPGPLLNLLGLPMTVRDLVFFGHVDEDSPLSGVANAGAYALGLYLAIVAAGLVVLVVRYAEVER